MTKSLSGTNDTGHLSDPSQDRGCPCGRSHPDTWGAKQRARTGWRPTADLSASTYAASIRQDGFRWEVANGQRRKVFRYAKDCENPITCRVNATDSQTLIGYDVRCRKCAPCLKAKARYWAAAGYHQTLLAAERGDRTWFGTLTLRPEEQHRLLTLAQSKWMDVHAPDSQFPAWWEDSLCDHRFALVRAELVRELQKYWKRLRKAGHSFSYLVAIERHDSGLPHVHWLLHEHGAPIRKRQLEAQWGLGYTKVVLVGGKSKRTAGPAKAAFYVVKYLQKSAQARQIASRGYRPKVRGPN